MLSPTIGNTDPCYRSLQAVLSPPPHLNTYTPSAVCLPFGLAVPIAGQLHQIRSRLDRKQRRKNAPVRMCNNPSPPSGTKREITWSVTVVRGGDNGQKFVAFTTTVLPLGVGTCPNQMGEQSTSFPFHSTGTCSAVRTCRSLLIHVPQLLSCYLHTPARDPYRNLSFISRLTLIVKERKKKKREAFCQKQRISTRTGGFFFFSFISDRVRHSRHLLIAKKPTETLFFFLPFFFGSGLGSHQRQKLYHRYMVGSPPPPHTPPMVRAISQLYLNPNSGFLSQCSRPLFIISPSVQMKRKKKPEKWIRHADPLLPIPNNQ